MLKVVWLLRSLVPLACGAAAALAAADPGILAEVREWSAGFGDWIVAMLFRIPG